MGCSNSKRLKDQGRRDKEIASKTLIKIREALKLKLELDGDSHELFTLERILLKFEKMHGYMKNVKILFTELSHDQKVMNIDGLVESMIVLHGKVSKEEVLDLFDYVDVDGTHTINLKEFLCLLTVALVLKIIPAFNEARESGTVVIRPSVSFMHGKNTEIKEMLELIVSAYLRFDPIGEGYIKEEKFTQILEEQGQVQSGHSKQVSSGKGSNNVSHLKWKEMDFDSDGRIDFAEFVYTFAKWVDIDDDFAEES